jgi:hypothetical protein
MAIFDNKLDCMMPAMIIRTVAQPTVLLIIGSCVALFYNKDIFKAGKIDGRFQFHN